MIPGCTSRPAIAGLFFCVPSTDCGKSRHAPIGESQASRKLAITKLRIYLRAAKEAEPASPSQMNKRASPRPNTAPPGHKKHTSHARRAAASKNAQSASKCVKSHAPLRPAAPVLMRLRPWCTFESKDPYIAGRCGGGTTSFVGT